MRKHKRQQKQIGRQRAGETAANVQTTLRVPALLYARAKSFVAHGASRSMNDLIVSALAAYVKAQERRAVDEAFRPMKDNREYQRQALRFAEEFAGSDAEAIKLTERNLLGS
jgi:hypothetical protein